LDRRDLFFVADDNDNSHYDWSLQPGKNTKISAQGQHRIARTGQHLWTGCLAKTVREIIIGSQKLENDNWDCILHCVFG
jgi:hypothetical protein